MNNIKKLGRIWKYALGSFSDEKTERYDNYVVLVRSFLFLTYLITNCFIVAGVIRHWNDVPNQNQLLVSKIGQKKFAQNFHL